jgi:hypothetical protein
MSSVGAIDAVRAYAVSAIAFLLDEPKSSTVMTNVWTPISAVHFFV